MRAQSAFCMRDLMSLAAAGAQTDELGRIYEWYSARTARALATSYAAATLAVGALLKYADDEHMTAAVIFLLGVVGVASISGIFQHAELAQLPRELAEATQLLAKFRWLVQAGVDLGRPLPAGKAEPEWAWLAWLAALLLPCLVAMGAVALTERHDSDVAFAAVACVVLIALLKRIFAEFPSVDAQDRADSGGTPTGSLVDLIGKYRLDEYVTDPVTAKKVNDSIRDLGQPPGGESRAGPE